MKTIQVAVVGMLCVWLGVVGEAGAAQEGWERLQEGARQACRAAAVAGRCEAQALERRQVGEDVFHYRWRVRVGPGEHDFIRLHRVVREGRRGGPRQGHTSVFLLHGDIWGFEPVYLNARPSGAEPPALFLARQGVDVWGMDMRWVLVPLEVSDFSFMQGWTLGSHAEDVRKGLAVARLVRLFTVGNGERLPLLGWSRGAAVAYAAASAEAVLPGWQRQVGALIPVDMVLRFGPEAEASRQAACQRYAGVRAMRDSGRYEGGSLGPATGLAVQAIAQGALLAPEGASPLVPGLNNRQAALLAGAATHVLQQGLPNVPGYHFHGGQFSGPLPTGLTWVAEADYLHFASQASPYQSLNEVVETEALLCNDAQLTGAHLPYDDHLARVSVPVLYLGAAGGFGAEGAFTPTLLGSRDITVRVASFYPPEARALDFGHSDLWLAPQARQHVWQPLLSWLRAH